MDKTLQDIQREALALELDCAVNDGFLDITGRGDPNLWYHSTQTVDDPRMLADAWLWLQAYRSFLEQADRARR